VASETARFSKSKILYIPPKRSKASPNLGYKKCYRRIETAHTFVEFAVSAVIAVKIALKIRDPQVSEHCICGQTAISGPLRHEIR